MALRKEQESKIWSLVQMKDDYGATKAIVLQEKDVNDPPIVALAIPLGSGVRWVILMTNNPITWSAWMRTIWEYTDIINTGEYYEDGIHTFLHIAHPNNEIISPEFILERIQNAGQEATKDGNDVVAG